MNLIEDPQGLAFEYLNQDEAEFLYEEVFVRRSYLQHGVVAENGAVVVDAGANIGLFSLHCLREAKEVQVYAFEPIPAIYDVLVRNLYNTTFASVSEGTCPKPIALRVALGEEKTEEEFHFFEDNPGESTRHGEEREKQQRTLAADADAASWKQALESPVRAPTPPHGVESSASKGHSDEAVEAGRKSEKGDNVRRVQTFGDADPDQGVKGEAATEEHAREEENKAGKGESFVCNVVPLSLALEQLQIANVDLLKVDVEGDELALLHGINGEDWPKIRQVALEVHDIDGRLAATIGLLKSEPAAFDEVCWEPQLTSEVGGYVMVVPQALKMFHVYAKRRRQRPAKPLSTDGGSATSPDSGIGDSGACCGGSGVDVGAAQSLGVVGGERMARRVDTIVGSIPPRFCACASV